MKRAVIFDMDGVLVDSYQPHFESWRALARESGIEMTETQFASSFGRTSREIIAEYWGDGLSAERVKAMDDRKELLYRQIIAKACPIMDGAVELIESLHADGFGIAVGSSGPPENVALVLDKLDRRPMFGAVVTGMDVTRGKPDPQVFLLAAQRLGVPPGRCVVVEDAPAGVAAANAAGMPCAAILGTAPPEKLSGARIIVSSLRELTPQRMDALLAGV